jgi:hypothetical protein
MDISSALICNYAEVREGILFVSGGCITRLWRTEYPASLGVCVVVVLEGTEGEMAGIAHDIRLVVRNADGEVAAELNGSLNAGPMQGLEPGETVQLPVVFNLYGVVIPRADAYDVDIELDGGERMGQAQRTQTIRARVQATPAAPTGTAAEGG